MRRIVATVAAAAAATFTLTGCSEQIDLAAFCASGENLGSALQDVDPSDVGATSDALGSLASELRALETPEDIAPDVETVAGGFDDASTSFGELAELEMTDPEYMDKALAASESVQSDEFNDAAQSIQDYTVENC